MKGEDRLLRETCPDEVAATAALARLFKEAQGHQAPNRDATFGLVLDKYLEVTDLAESTLVTHKSYIRRVIPGRPASREGARHRRGHARRPERAPQTLLDGYARGSPRTEHHTE